MKKEVKLYKTTSVSFATEPDAVFFVKGINETVVRTYVTTSDGQAIPLKDLSGGGSGSGIQSLASEDSSINITGTATSKNIQVSSALQTLINSALQANDPISSLLNDSNFITLADVPTFNPSDYDLSDFTNNSTNPFVKQSDITSGATNLGYTASSTNGVVTSDTGSDATIPLADNTNAGLLSPAEKSEIATAIQPSDLGTVATSNDYNDLDNIPSSFSPSAHTHVEADITDLDKYTQAQTDTLLNGKVPYTGATTNVDLGEFQLKAGQIEFDQTPTGTFGVGKVRWNDTDGTTERRLKGNNVTLQDGLEVLKRVVNKAGSDLLEANYQVVRTRSVAEGGAQGQRPAVVLAQANTNDNSKGIIGVVTETILNNQEGFITLIGEVRNVNTTGSLQSETWVDGDLLYLSPIVAGQLTKVVPSSPHYSIPIGTVDYAHATQGKISVHVGNKIALDTTLTNDNDTAPSVTAVKTYIDSGLATKQDVLTYTPVKIAIKDTVSSSAVTGSTLNTLAKTYEILGNVFDGNDAFNLEVNLEKTGVAGTSTVRVYVNTVNDFATATLISTTTSASASIRDIPSSRLRANFKGTDLKIVTRGSTLLNDLNQGFNTPRTALPLNPANNFFVFVAIQNANAGDSTVVDSVHLTT
jgi:hypothetical protein